MLDNVLLQFATLLGFAALVSLLVNVLKVFGVVKDDTADKWVAGFNLIGILALYVVRLFAIPVDISGLDAAFLEVAAVGSFILSYVMMLGGSKLTYFITKGLPVIGRSNTPEK